MKDGFAALIELQFNIATPWQQDCLKKEYTATGEKKNKTFIDLKITKQPFKPDKPPKNSLLLLFFISQ